jgi:hypothetical protein
MSRYRAQIAEALRAVAIRGEDRYTWLDRRSRSLAASLLAHMDAAGRRRYLVNCLRDELYSSFYCTGRVVPARWGAAGPVGADARLVQAISEAGAGSAGWEAGWTVERVDGEGVVVSANGVRGRASLTECRAPDGAPAPGAAVSMTAPPEPSVLSPGFLAMMGDAGAGGEAGEVRVYWHVTPAGAPVLVRAVTERLNAEAAPFRLKVADHPLRFDRCDAAVLYLPPERFVGLRPWLESLATQLARWLRPDVPALALPLAPGAGLAECDGVGESFGERRCALLAEGIVSAHEVGATGTEARLAAVASCLARAGVRVDAPYLEPTMAGRHVL